MKIFYPAVLALFLFALPCQAQQFFTPGFAVTSTGDTLRGEIREQSNTLIEFRHAQTRVTTSFGTAEVRSYTTEGIFHTAATWQEDDGVPGRSFLIQRVRGYVNLYSLPQETGTFRYVMQLPDGTFVPLRGKLAWGKLNLLLNECDDAAFARRIQPNLFHYDLSYFKGIIDAYNACVRPDLVVRTPKKPFHFEGGVVGGVGRNQWNYFFSARNVIPELPVGQLGSAALRPVFGAFFTVQPQKRLSATVEVNYTTYKGSLTVIYSSSVNPRTESNYFFEEAYVSVPVSGKYVWLNRAVRGYVRGGFAFTVPTHQRTQRKVVGSTDIYDLPQLRSGIGFGLLAGVGVEGRLGGKRRVFAELRAQRHSVTEGVTRIALSYSIQALVGVSLFQK